MVVGDFGHDFIDLMDISDIGLVVRQVRAWAVHGECLVNAMHCSGFEIYISKLMPYSQLAREEQVAASLPCRTVCAGVKQGLGLGKTQTPGASRNNDDFARQVEFRQQALPACMFGGVVDKSGRAAGYRGGPKRAQAAVDRQHCSFGNGLSTRRG